MKKQIVFVTVVLLCGLGVSCAKTPAVIPGPWSAEEGGVQAALRIQKTETASDTSVSVSVVFRNDGDTPCRLPVDPYYTVNWSHDGIPVADSIGNATIPGDEALLQPGEEREYVLDGLRIAMNGPGVYSAQGGIGAIRLGRVELEVR
jgi:hypothetical protein